MMARRSGRSALHEHLIDSVLPGEDSAFEALQAHISRLRKKLGASGAAIVTVPGIGYRLEADVVAGQSDRGPPERSRATDHADRDRRVAVAR